MARILTPRVKFFISCAAILLLAMSYALWPDHIDQKGAAALQTNMIRAIIVFECGWITSEFWEIKKLLAVERFTRLANRLFYTFLIFTGLRVLAAVIDYFLAFSIGWASTVVNCGFFFYIGLIVRRQRIRIENSEFDSMGERKASVAVRNFLTEVSDISYRLKQIAK